MIVLTILLFIIYAIYFRADGGNYANIIKILKGLNSNTFNYLETNKNLLGLERAMPDYKIEHDNAAAKNVNTLQFFSDCVRLNRPCALRNLAEKWPATQKWSTAAGAPGWANLEKAFGDTKLDVYQKMATGLLAVASRVWSFAGSHKQVQDFKSFHESVSKK